MEAHYFGHDSFMAPDQLLANAHRLTGIRGVIVQGRYDLLCPPAPPTPWRPYGPMRRCA